MLSLRHAAVKSDRQFARPRLLTETKSRVQENLNQFGYGANVVQRKPTCICGGGCPRCLGVQAKLRVGQPGDRYEREADRVAEGLMRAPDTGARLPTSSSSGESIPSAVGLDEALVGSKGGGHSLDPATRSFMENRLGADFSHVRLHTDSRAAAMSHALQAKAFTQGSDVYFHQGQYQPGTTAGRSLLAHELTHVVQQRGAPMIQCYDWGLDEVPGMAEWAEERHRRSPLRDITVVDWGESWNGFNLAAGLFHIGEIDVSSVDDMVTQILDSLHEGDCINTLTIIGHGSPGTISVGDGTGCVEGRYIGGATLDPGSPAYNPEMVALLGRLTPRFCEDGQAVLRGCDVGNGDLGEMFVQRLADLWGVRVRAHIGTIRAGGEWTTGEWADARPRVRRRQQLRRAP